MKNVSKYSPGTMRAKNPKSFLKLASPRMSGKKSKSFNLNSFKIKSMGMNNFFNLFLSANWKSY